MGYEIEKFKIKIGDIEIIKDLVDSSQKKMYIYSASSISNPHNNTILFANCKFDVSNLNNCLIIIKDNINIENDKNVFIKTKNPRLEYAKILKYILNKNSTNNKYTLTTDGYYVGKNVRVGDNTVIEPMVFLDDNVIIGNNSYIKSGAKIRQYSVIGDNCIIKENCVIGSSGFGMEKDKEGNVHKIPHIGGVKIGNKVEVGALASIASGTIDPTIIEENVQIDDCVFIAHNCHIGRSSLIIANSEISGSVVIGCNCWIGPNSSIRQKLKIGDNVMLGIGSVVTKSIEENSIVAGNPADNIELIKKRRYIQRKLDELYK